MRHVSLCPSLVYLTTFDLVPHHDFLARPQLLTR
jgi:hypothetical protein